MFVGTVSHKNIVDQPVLVTCKEAKWQPGLTPWKYWYKLLLKMELNAGTFRNDVDKEGQGVEACGIGARRSTARPAEVMTLEQCIAFLR